MVGGGMADALSHFFLDSFHVPVCIFFVMRKICFNYTKLSSNGVLQNILVLRHRNFLKIPAVSYSIFVGVCDVIYI